MVNYMSKYLIIDKITAGYKIKDSITNNYILYSGYTLKQAIQQHRKKFNLKYKHLEIIYI